MERFTSHKTLKTYVINGFRLLKHLRSWQEADTLKSAERNYFTQNGLDLKVQYKQQCMIVYPMPSSSGRIVVQLSVAEISVLQGLKCWNDMKSKKNQNPNQ